MMQHTEKTLEKKEAKLYLGINPIPTEPIIFHPFLESADKFVGIKGKGRSLMSVYTAALAPCTCGSTFCFTLRLTKGLPKLLREGDPTEDVFVRCMDCGKQNETRSGLESINDWNKKWNELHPEKTYPIYSEFPLE